MGYPPRSQDIRCDFGSGQPLVVGSFHPPLGSLSISRGMIQRGCLLKAGRSAQNPVMPRPSWQGTWRKNGSPPACPPVSSAALPPGVGLRAEVSRTRASVANTDSRTCGRSPYDIGSITFQVPQIRRLLDLAGHFLYFPNHLAVPGPEQRRRLCGR